MNAMQSNNRVFAQLFRRHSWKIRPRSSIERARVLRPTFHELFALAERARRARSAASRDHQASGTNERRETPLSVAPPER